MKRKTTEYKQLKKKDKNISADEYIPVKTDFRAYMFPITGINISFPAPNGTSRNIT